MAIAAPLIGDIGSVLAALIGQSRGRDHRRSAVVRRVRRRFERKNLAKMAQRLAADPSPMHFHSALRAIRDVLKTRPDIYVVNEGANTLDYARSIIDMYEPRNRFDSGTWGIMGIGMGFAIGAAVTSGKPVVAIEGDSAFGFSAAWNSKPSAATTCRSAPSSSTTTASIAATTSTRPAARTSRRPSFVKSARYDKMIEAFGGVGYHATTPEELTNALPKPSRRASRPHQRRHRPKRRHRKRPPDQPQPAKARDA